MKDITYNKFTLYGPPKGRLKFKSHKPEKKYKRKGLLKVKGFRIELINNATRPELKFRKALDVAGISYEFQKIIYTHNGYKIVDFFLTNEDKAIEIDGAHHFTANGKYKDDKRTDDLIYTGKVDNVIRFDNKFINNHTVKQILDTLYVILNT